MGIRAVLGLVLVAGSLIPATPAVATHTNPNVPSLGARNTITATRSGGMDVMLPNDVKLPLNERTRWGPGPAPWVTFEGPGRIAGIVLVPSGSASIIRDGLVAVQFRSCPKRCQHLPVNALMIKGTSFDGRETLRSGLYRLYVIADAGDLRVTLDLPQLEGRTSLHVGGPKVADIATPVPHIAQSDGVTVYSAGASYDMTDHNGLFMSVNVLRDEQYRGGAFHECLSSEMPVPDELERTKCAKGHTFLATDPTPMVQPIRGGYILTSFFGLNDSLDNAFNGDSSRHHYSFEVVSPGSMGELWSQAALLSY